MTTMPELGLGTARRLAVQQQALAGPPYPATRAGLLDVIRQIRCVQLDPISAVIANPYLVLWSRVGQYDIQDFEHLRWARDALFEYWAHAASIVLTEDYPIHHWAMGPAAYSESSIWGQRQKAFREAHRDYEQFIRSELAARGPLAPAEIEDRSVDGWGSSGWTTQVKAANTLLEMLYREGQVTVAKRKGTKRWWVLLDDFLPDWTPRDVLDDHEVTRRAVRLALNALGVATAKQINEHFTRHRYPALDAVLAELVDSGELLPVTIVDGDDPLPGEWYMPAQLAATANALDGDGWQPRTTLLSPFDNLIADRDRTEALFGFFYRSEIYTPKAKRQFGYYVMPILHGERLIGRIDPKFERKTGVLHVHAVFAEDNAPPQYSQ